MKSYCLPLFLALIGMTVPATLAAAETAGKGFPVRTGAPTAAATVTRRSIQTTPAPAPVPVAASAVAPAATPVAATGTGGEVAAVAAGNYENQPIAFAGPRRRPNRDGDNREYVMPSIWPALLAVIGVCGVFCVGLYLMKKYIPGHRQLFSHPAMEVLGRTHLDQRRYVSLLRVGKRIVVLGVSPDEIRSLSEITDEEEITGILEVARPKTEAGLTIFQRLFQRTVVDAEAAETRAMADVKANQINAQMSTLRQRVAEIRGVGTAEPEKEAARQHVDAVG
ncbi:MAG: flagellar biosynthetic protein FliO [Planctomycetaceae bacterium]|nr:flagellar biosynthetic protein FliO [Planctomycetaceae bacterium]